MNRGGITKRIVNAANAIIGHVRGGLGYVAIMAISIICKYDRISSCVHCIPWSNSHSYDGACGLQT